MLTLHGLRWYGRGETVTVGEYLLRDPMVYVSHGRPPEEEASCIDLSLEVGQPLAENVVGLRKNPSYALLSPNQRAYYLRWMSNGRVGPLENIGFAFLFFYGLERRLLVEQQDQGPIVEEVVRLLDTYPSFGLFDAHLNLFLAFALARLGIDSIDDHLFSEVFEKTRLKWDESSLPLLKWDESLLAVALAWFYKRRLFLPASWAIRAARKDPHFPNRAASTIQPEKLNSLFKRLYREQFGSGLILDVTSDDRKMAYRPASASLLRDTNSSKLSTRSIKIPDVLGYKSQFDPLVTVLSRCVDDLSSTNRVSVARVEDTKRDPRRIRWHGNGESVAVGAIRLSDPMVYVSERQPSESEPSCIDLSLAVGKPVWENPGRLGYNPSYGRLRPGQRANYLLWLSNGRVDPLHDISYALLFFYGLERRLLVERKDLSPIVKETVRLLETYTFSGLFDGYLSRFLAYALASAGIDTINDQWIELIFEKSRRMDEDFLAVALAWFFNKNAPLPASWARKVASQDQRTSESVVIDRVPEEFNTRFEERYHERFGDGMTLKVSKRERLLTYRPASPSPVFDAELPGRSTEPIAIPNVFGIQSQFAPLATIWSRCISDLRSVSRIVASGCEVTSRGVFERLPAGLKARIEHPDKGKWYQLVTEHTREDGYALVEVSKLAAIHGLEAKTKLAPIDCESMARTAEYLGLLIEPDVRLTKRPYRWDDVVSLFRSEEGSGLPFDSPRYLAASLMLELGIYVAAADGSVDNVEVDQVARFLESQFLLNPPDARRLEALKRVFMARPPTLADLGKKLHTALSWDQRDAIGRSLIGIAAANGIIDRKKISALRSAYRALDIGRDQLKNVLKQLRRSSQDPIEVERGERLTERGETIPARTQAGRSEGFTLDEGVLRRLMAETEQVAKMLGEAMREGSLADETEQPVVRPVVDARFKALDTRFHALLSQLLSRPVWRRAEFESLARACGLMPDGALDAVNTWAYELFDDPIIIEQGEELAVHSHLVETLS